MESLISWMNKTSLLCASRYKKEKHIVIFEIHHSIFIFINYKLISFHTVDDNLEFLIQVRNKYLDCKDIYCDTNRFVFLTYIYSNLLRAVWMSDA